MPMYSSIRKEPSYKLNKYENNTIYFATPYIASALNHINTRMYIE